MTHEELEEGRTLALDWGKLRAVTAGEEACLPVVVQDANSGAVLILAYANEWALAETLRRRVAVLWSTSRGELWVKGASSGNVLELVEVRVNCEQNSLLYRVRVAPGQGACHTRGASGTARFGCYYRVLEPGGELRLAADEGRPAPAAD
ncbi:MAG: phosphoribosyl-AMP cyclohydrolase [Opitutales bacterium]